MVHYNIIRTVKSEHVSNIEEKQQFFLSNVLLKRYNNYHNNIMHVKYSSYTYSHCDTATNVRLDLINVNPAVVKSKSYNQPQIKYLW